MSHNLIRWSLFSLILLGATYVSSAREPNLNALFLDESENGRSWRLDLLDGKPYYTTLSRPRRPDDRDSEIPYPNGSRVWHFSIDKQGDGIGIRFIVNGGGGGGYLTADYSTEPPSVVMSVEPTKYSAWQVHKDVDGKSFLENLNTLGKRAWLSMEPKGITTRVGRDDKRVAEYRRPTLSFDKQYVVTIHKVEMSK